jgi:hypothetical protein
MKNWFKIINENLLKLFICYFYKEFSLFFNANYYFLRYNVQIQNHHSNQVEVEFQFCYQYQF